MINSVSKQLNDLGQLSEERVPPGRMTGAGGSGGGLCDVRTGVMKPR